MTSKIPSNLAEVAIVCTSFTAEVTLNLRLIMQPLSG